MLMVREDNGVQFKWDIAWYCVILPFRAISVETQSKAMKLFKLVIGSKISRCPGKELAVLALARKSSLNCDRCLNWSITFVSSLFFSNVYCNADARFYDVLQVEISSWPSWIQQIVNFVTTITFIFPILTVVWWVYNAPFFVMSEKMVNSYNSYSYHHKLSGWTV